MAFIYLDSCVSIYYVEGAPELQALVEPVLRRSDSDRFALADLTRFECRVAPLRSGDAALLADYDRFFRVPQIEPLQLDRAVFDLATNLRADHGLKTPDALHLGAALVGGCDAIFTLDEHLTKAASGKIRVLSTAAPEQDR